MVTLGCSKNFVDSERLVSLLSDAGFDARHEDDDNDVSIGETDIVVVNTCGFIGDAKEESVNEIISRIDSKNRGEIERVYVMGCLSERYREELTAELPEVDGIYGKFDWVALASDLAKAYPGAAPFERTITRNRHNAYIKISEGCNRFCAFCAIPLITGRLKSRAIDDILSEVRQLADKGIKEFNLIAQDLSDYGTDFSDGKSRLAELIDRIADIEGVEWIRLHYAYPTSFPTDVLDVMARRPNVCKYLDIALQHSSDNVLSRMRRHITAKEQAELLAEMRRKVPGLHLRTTLMVGFPGETDADFENLLNFVKEQKFERMGAFAYCEEEDTYAARNYTDDVPPSVKQKRLDRLMELQQEISQEIQNKKIGSTLRVIIDREDPDYYIGRTEWDSPEVDPEVLIEKSEKLSAGQFVNVLITDALPFELIGKPIRI